MEKCEKIYDLVLFETEGQGGRPVVQYVCKHMSENLRWAIVATQIEQLESLVKGMKESYPDRKSPGNECPSIIPVLITNNTFSCRALPQRRTESHGIGEKDKGCHQLPRPRQMQRTHSRSLRPEWSSLHHAVCIYTPHHSFKPSS